MCIVLVETTGGFYSQRIQPVIEEYGDEYNNNNNTGETILKCLERKQGACVCITVWCINLAIIK